MPHTTFGYPFEAKVHGFAGEVSSRSTSREDPRSFLILFDRDGNVLSLTFEGGSADWRDMSRKVIYSDEPHLFYDPLDDGKEYIWLSWKGVDQSVMERLIGVHFEDTDFTPYPGYRRARALEPPNKFPGSWGVML